MSQPEHYHAVRTERPTPTEDNGWSSMPEERVVLGDPKPTPDLANLIVATDEAEYVHSEDRSVSWEVNGPCDCDPEGAAREAEEAAVRDAEANEARPLVADDDQS